MFTNFFKMFFLSFVFSAVGIAVIALSICIDLNLVFVSTILVLIAALNYFVQTYKDIDA